MGFSCHKPTNLGFPMVFLWFGVPPLNVSRERISPFVELPSEWGARWRIQWAAEGVLNARVDVGVGELQMVRSRAAGGLPSEIWRFP